MKRISILFLSLFILIFPLNGFAKNKVTLYLFYGEGCPHCAEEEKFLKTVEKKYKDLKIVRYEVWYNEDNASFLQEVQEALSINQNGVPTTIIGDTVMTGYASSAGSKIERAIEYYLDGEYVDEISKIKDGTFVREDFSPITEFEEKEKETDEDMSVDVPLIGKVNMKNVSLTTAAVVIGLIDGFNPCAMWVLLFLISVLIGMKNRKRMWIIGLTFLFTSALVYFFIMLSWIEIVLKITTIIWIRNLIGIAAIIGAFVNLYNFFKTSDSGCEIVDDKKRKTIFSRIRKFTSEKSLLFALIGIIGLAISVNMVELACSAGLPIVFSELLVLNNTSFFMRLMYTILYVIFFLLDDLVVFFIAMFTMKITGISTKYNKYSHLLGGIIMFIVGFLLLFKPEWLMFQFK